MAFPELSSPALLSPMAGVTDVAFRALCKRYGAGLTCTEFVSSAALVRGSEKTAEMLVTDPSEIPVAVQLFGASEEDVVGAAKLVEKFDIIDINCGCPAWKVIKTGAGSALLNDPRKIAHFVTKIVAAVKKPITVKIRAGVDERSINAVEVAKAVEAAGAAAIGIHGRTQKQGYSGKSNWEIIKQVKGAISIPVIGNGDVFSAADFMEKWKFSGCDYILIARGAIGNPEIFAEINAMLAGKTHKCKSKHELLLEYLELAKKYKVSFNHIKNHAMSFTKGVVGGATIRERITMLKNLAELEALLATKF